MTRKQRRLTMIGGALAVLAIAAALVLNALRDSIVFFTTPAHIAEKNIVPGQRFRLGGLVQPGSLVRGDKLHVKFEVTDGKAAVPVAFQDERLSTSAVERFLIEDLDLNRKRRANVIDRTAAAWILQGALDRLRDAAGR